MWDILKDVERLPNKMQYILETGLYWPLLSGGILYASWNLWPQGSDVKILFVIAVVFASMILLPFYPYLNRRRREKLEAEIGKQKLDLIHTKDAIKGRVRLLYDARDKQAWPEGYNESWEWLYNELFKKPEQNG